jgi:ribosomal protein S18 acetylase RimI-like enzyme
MLENVMSVAQEGIYLATELAPWSLEQLREILLDNGRGHLRILVAEVDNLVVGDLWLSRGRLNKTRHTATIGMSLIAPYRGQGIGRALLGRAIEEAAAWGVEKLGLSVFSSNLPAIGLYRSLGFAEDGRRERQYRLSIGDVDEVMMARWLV